LQLTIQELARRARVTPRTIRYYVEQGVLPPPHRGRPAEYTDEHLRRLALIRRLKEQYLPLEEIRDTMQRLSLGEVEELLARSSTRPHEERPGSAADYIARVLDRTAVREEMKMQAPPPPPAAPPAAPTPAYPASAPVRKAPQWPERALQESVEADPADLSFLREPALAGYAAPGEAASEPQAAPQSTTWQRITLAPGIELHYLAAAGPGMDEIVARLVEAAARILEEFPGTRRNPR
jgi:DNA-binding transcriptional MerR regulator